ncbi:MAG: SUMF1/EgtB/PvdO family nonheme iron enzyme [Candidatus Omnitrophota bacterium]
MLYGCVLAAVVCLFLTATECFANNLSVSDTSLTGPSASAKTIKIQFDISWSNSWRNSVNYDAVWVFAKYKIVGDSNWYHVNLKTTGTTQTNPSGYSRGSGTAIDIVAPVNADDSMCYGCFIQRSGPGIGSVSTTSIQLVWDWGPTGNDLDAADTIDEIKVYGIEMVYIPSAVFSAGDNATGTAAFKQGSADNDPWSVTSEDAISVTAGASDGYYYVSGGNSGEDASGSVFTIPAAFPKGYSAFYVMKHEISQGQYTDFLNMLTSLQAANRFPNQNGNNRHTITGSHPNHSTTRSDRACNYLSWMDVAAYADWAGLRPMTELEYEKICRGTNAAVSGEYAWGSTSVTAAVTISGTENGAETITTSGANCCYNNQTFTDGDGGTGPLRCGIFATSISIRATSGGAYYGPMEFSGNCEERVVTVGSATGRVYTGTHGDGTLTLTASYEGNATNSDWPGIDATPANGVSGAAGSGGRGGEWNGANTLLRVSDRTNGAAAQSTRTSTGGGRLARAAS